MMAHARCAPPACRSCGWALTGSAGWSLSLGRARWAPFYADAHPFSDWWMDGWVPYITRLVKQQLYPIVMSHPVHEGFIHTLTSPDFPSFLSQEVVIQLLVSQQTGLLMCAPQLINSASAHFIPSICYLHAPTFVCEIQPSAGLCLCVFSTTVGQLLPFTSCHPAILFVIIGVPFIFMTLAFVMGTSQQQTRYWGHHVIQAMQAAGQATAVVHAGSAYASY